VPLEPLQAQHDGAAALTVYMYYYDL